MSKKGKTATLVTGAMPANIPTEVASPIKNTVMSQKRGILAVSISAECAEGSHWGKRQYSRATTPYMPKVIASAGAGGMASVRRVKNWRRKV